MKTITLKVDESLGHWLEMEARKLGRTKSEIAREALEMRRNGQQGQSVHGFMKDFVASSKVDRAICPQTRNT
ncbi:MAG: CopG family transcriptional regulator [Verrucomicrobia bacterium]|nr:CopG family transcriptional regulator [Verrucomicrobiota bacterium]